MTRHCEKRSDEAIQQYLTWIAAPSKKRWARNDEYEMNETNANSST